MIENEDLAAVILVLMSAAGALARLLMRMREALNIFRAAAELFTAGFMGMMLFFISRELKIESGWMFASAGIAGWVGPQVLDWLASIVEAKTGIKPPDASAPLVVSTALSTPTEHVAMPPAVPEHAVEPASPPPPSDPPVIPPP